MGQRGRKSSAELQVVDGGGGQAAQAPAPPADLSGEAADEWRAIIAEQADGWLTRARAPMLAALCRHTVAQRRIGQLVDQCVAAENAAAFDVGHYKALLAMQREETRCIATLSVRLGFAETTGAGKGGAGKPLPPWGASPLEDAIARAKLSGAP